MKYKNPYKEGSFSWQQFNTYVQWYQGYGRECLIKLYKKAKAEGQNFCRHGWQTMANFDFQAKCVASIFEQKFNEPIAEGSQA